MKYMKYILSFVLAFGLLYLAPMTSYAHEAPDTSKTGSLSVSMTYDGKSVAGGTLALYRVGKINKNDGSYHLTLTTDFAESNVSLDNISSSNLAKTLAEYASEKKLPKTATKIGQDGTVTVNGLNLGLYLVVQTKAADGYAAIAPFLVSIPMNENGTYVYNVDATPKLSTLKKTPGKPAAPNTPTTPSKLTKATLPQTGQLNWPIPVLSILGLLLFSIGWTLRFGKRETPYEA